MNNKHFGGPRPRLRELVADDTLDPGNRVELRRRMSALRLIALSGLSAATAAWILRGSPEATAPLEMVPASEAAADVTLPVEMNERVNRWIERYKTTQRAGFERYLARQGLYAGLIQSKLRERGMPEDLLFLAMIESGFSSRAVSAVSAVGVWQFMSPTARQYGLRVDDWVDERRDPVRATDAALDYLEWLYDRYGSWYLAAAAYNSGPGRVDRVLRRHANGRRGDEAIYWDIIDHLPRETREYVPKVLAATVLAREAAQNGFRVVPDSPYMYDRVWVPGGTSLTKVARGLDIPVSTMRDLNPHLIRGVTPPGAAYGLRVPVGKTGEVVAQLGPRPTSVD